MSRLSGSARDVEHAERTAGWMRQNSDLYRMVLRTALGLERGSLTEAEHRMAKRRAKLALDAYDRQVRASVSL